MTGEDPLAPPGAVTDTQSPASGAETLSADPSGDRAKRTSLIQPWLGAAARVLVFRAPRLDPLAGSPAVLALLTLCVFAVALGAQRAVIDGPADFYWTGALQGWAGIAIGAWLCWAVARSGEGKTRAETRASAGTLMSLLTAVSLIAGLGWSGVYWLVQRSYGSSGNWPQALSWGLWLLPLVWMGLANLRLLWRHAGSYAVRALCVLVVPLPLVIGSWLQPIVFWWPQMPEETGEVRHLQLTDEVLAAQARFMTGAPVPLSPPVPERVNLYAITYAPHATEDVFMRESAVVAKTLADRFDAGGRTVQLVVHPDTATTFPWATPRNLRHMLAQMARVMDRERDVLFIHLTSHGGQDGKLAVSAWPLSLEPVTPADLKQWLDEAGIKWRVVSVSACYSGSWIEPLASDNTLVMTAADADHTSYGCGRRSTLTYFGRAMYEEGMRATWSFKDAHAEARKVIEVREQEAGKTDGYSNPQISEGRAIAPVLERLARERGARMPSR
jgi:hypothetical protein